MISFDPPERPSEYLLVAVGMWFIQKGLQRYANRTQTTARTKFNVVIPADALPQTKRGWAKQLTPAAFNDDTPAE